MPEMISTAEADALLAALPRTTEVTLPLARCQGRILRGEVVSDRPQPPFHRVAMDGIAFAFSEWEKGVRRFAVRGSQKAGEKPKPLSGESGFGAQGRSPWEGGCLKAMTGAVLPSGADCIAPVEEVRFEDGYAVIGDGFAAQPGRFIHRAGSDCDAGEMLVPAGTVLEAAHLGTAAACGKTALRVGETPGVAVIATGDELVDPGRIPAAHQIRRSNPHAVEAALRKRRIERVALLHCRDDAARLRAAVEGVLGKCQVLILIGGVSMGDADHVPAVLQEMGVRPVFHKIRQKPGKPFWFGLASGDRPVFGLPGNPASVLVCLHRYVMPALMRSMGAAESAFAPIPCVAAEAIPAPGRLTQFRPATFAWGEDGRLRATWVANQGSGDFTGWSRAQGFVEIPAGETAVPAGTVLKAWMW
jgi:molybdopterin molybdotransferase